MTDTANLGLPCIEGSQAQKHVTHNDALRILDTLVQLAVADRDLTAPPGSPVEGERWIVKTGATGAWAGHDDAIASWQDGAWQFCMPQIGWVAFVIDEGALFVWNGSAWGDYFSTVTAIQNLALLGVGTTADATNPLSAKLNNALFAAKTMAEGGDGDLRYKLSKETAGKTLSILFQDNYSGRAEFGLTGDDDFHIKVSPDGSTFYEALVVDRNTGAVSFPVASAGGLRDKLAAHRAYYVNNATGSDADNGRTVEAAFATIQKAIDTVASLDLSIYDATIYVANGTYVETLTMKSLVGAGMAYIVGDTGTPANVEIAPPTDQHCITGTFDGIWNVQGFRLSPSGGGYISCISLTQGNGILKPNNIEFNAATVHIAAYDGATVAVAGNYTIIGGANQHFEANGGGRIFCQNVTVTLSGTPAFATVFARAIVFGLLKVNGTVFSGSATGVRYSAATNSIIFTNGGGASFLPGSSAGSTATGGQYV